MPPIYGPTKAQSLLGHLHFLARKHSCNDLQHQLCQLQLFLPSPPSPSQTHSKFTLTTVTTSQSVILTCINPFAQRTGCPHAGKGHGGFSQLVLRRKIRVMPFSERFIIEKKKQSRKGIESIEHDLCNDPQDPHCIRSCSQSHAATLAPPSEESHSAVAGA